MQGCSFLDKGCSTTIIANSVSMYCNNAYSFGVDLDGAYNGSNFSILFYYLVEQCNCSYFVIDSITSLVIMENNHFCVGSNHCGDGMWEKILSNCFNFRMPCLCWCTRWNISLTIFYKWLLGREHISNSIKRKWFVVNCKFIYLKLNPLYTKNLFQVNFWQGQFWSKIIF